MSDAESWIREVMAARRAGRQISCHVLSGDGLVTLLESTEGAARWPSGMIVAPPLQPDGGVGAQAPSGAAKNYAGGRA